jgi:hypothetical protein
MDRQFYLSCWSGSTAQVDRKSLEDPILVSEPFLNLLGGIQPEMLSTLEDERGREDGFIHRFLFTFPLPPGRRDLSTAKGVSRSARDTWNKVVDWLFQLALREPEAGEPNQEPQPRTLTLTEEAAQLWHQWNRQHWDETEWDCFPHHLLGVWSKFDVHALTLVLVAHMLRIACDQVVTGQAYQQQDPPIDADSMRRGLMLADYFKDHVVRVFHRLKVNHEDLKAERAISWIRKRPGQRVSPRELQQNGVVGIKTSSEAEDLLKKLADRGLGEIRTTPGRNRNKQVVTYFQATR